MSVPSRQHKPEGPKGLLCTGSGVYVGILPGHRDDCSDCGRRVKVKKGGYLGDHTPLAPRTHGARAVVRANASPERVGQVTTSGRSPE